MLRPTMPLARVRPPRLARRAFPGHRMPMTWGERYIALTVGPDQLPSGLTFGKVVNSCVDVPVVHENPPCAIALEPRLSQDVASLVPQLTDTYRALLAKAPNADIFVLGYPSLFPSNPAMSSCEYIRASDVDYLKTKEADLNQAIQQATAAAGPRVHYVDLSH